MKPKKQNEERDQERDGSDVTDLAASDQEPMVSYLTIPVAFGMAVVLEEIPGTGFEGLAIG
jgi:hypothetical protein